LRFLQPARAIASTALLAFTILSCSCARLYVDPSAGDETLLVRTIERPDDFTVEYLRAPQEGPLRHEANAWTLFWFVPLNQPDLGLWLQDSLPEGAQAANVRASVQTPWYGHLLFFPTLGLVRVDRVRFEAQPIRYSFLREAPKEALPEPIADPALPAAD